MSAREAAQLFYNSNKLTEAIPNLSWNNSIAVDMTEVSEAAPPNAESALDRKLNTMNSLLPEIQAPKLSMQEKENVTCSH